MMEHQGLRTNDCKTELLSEGRYRRTFRAVRGRRDPENNKHLQKDLFQQTRLNASMVLQENEENKLGL